MTIKITWLGTAAYLLDLDGKKLLFDPFFFRNDKSSPVLKTKREEINNLAAVFVTHAHIDHVTDAAWYAENQDVPVYTSEAGKENMIKWCAGDIINFDEYPINFMTEPYELTDKGIDHINVIDWGDRIQIADNISVTAIKSEHVKFDLETIFARLKSKAFLKNLKSMAPLGRNLPMGKVFGYAIEFNDKTIVSFGSLCDKYPEELRKFENCDLFIAPLAGNSAKNIAKKGGNMTKYLNPKMVIPLHWDNFFPPISRIEDISKYEERMEKEMPDLETRMLEFDTPTTLEL